MRTPGTTFGCDSSAHLSRCHAHGSGEECCERNGADEVYSWTLLFVSFAGNYWSEIEVFQQERSRRKKNPKQPLNMQRIVLVLQIHIASIKIPPAHPGWYPGLYSFPQLTGCIKYMFNEAVTGLWIQAA